MARVSIIIPVLNEARTIAATLDRIPNEAEVIVVDGGSTDNTVEVAMGFADQVVQTARGRARQMHAGALAASGSVLVFLHADTMLPPGVMGLLDRFAAGDRLWGRFDVVLDDPHPAFRVIEFMMNLRSRTTGIATGDQAIFVRRVVYGEIGGFREMPLMEDIDFSRRLRGLSWPLCLRQKVVTSARRWRTYGILRTVLLMWRLRLLFFFGVPAERLAEEYLS